MIKAPITILPTSTLPGTAFPVAYPSYSCDSCLDPGLESRAFGPIPSSATSGRQRSRDASLVTAQKRKQTAYAYTPGPRFYC
jgi:hypothetical protein